MPDTVLREVCADVIHKRQWGERIRSHLTDWRVSSQPWFSFSLLRKTKKLSCILHTVFHSLWCANFRPRKFLVPIMPYIYHHSFPHHILLDYLIPPHRHSLATNFFVCDLHAQSGKQCAWYTHCSVPMHLCHIRIERRAAVGLNRESNEWNWWEGECRACAQSLQTCAEHHPRDFRQRCVCLPPTQCSVCY